MLAFCCHPNTATAPLLTRFLLPPKALRNREHHQGYPEQQRERRLQNAPIHLTTILHDTLRAQHPVALIPNPARTLLALPRCAASSRFTEAADALGSTFRECRTGKAGEREMLCKISLHIKALSCSQSWARSAQPHAAQEPAVLSDC